MVSWLLLLMPVTSAFCHLKILGFICFVLWESVLFFSHCVGAIILVKPLKT